ncbi:unnamed protein product [Victoria cruziana]
MVVGELGKQGTAHGYLAQGLSVASEAVFRCRNSKRSSEPVRIRSSRSSCIGIASACFEGTATTRFDLAERDPRLVPLNQAAVRPGRGGVPISA